MITLDPTANITFTLPRYEERPKAEQPIFVARALTAREASAVPGEMERINTLPHADQPEAIVKLVGPMLRSVQSQELLPDGKRTAFEVSQLPDVLSLDELFTLPLLILRANSLSGADRKKSVSPSVSATAAAAGDAPPASA